jgi:hypothetical protein
MTLGEAVNDRYRVSRCPLCWIFYVQEASEPDTGVCPQCGYCVLTGVANPTLVASIVTRATSVPGIIKQSKHD